MTTLVELIQERGLEAVGRFYSKYRAIVVDNKDPDSIQNLMVVIPSIHDGIRTWARPKSQQGGIKYGMKYLTPMIGEVVWVEFEKGNPLKPLWSFHSWAIDEIPEELKENDTLGIVTPQGNKIFLKDDDGKLSISINKEIDIGVKDNCSFILDTDKVEVIKGENTHIVLTDKGITVNKGNFGLKKTLQELLKAIQELTVNTPQGVSSVPNNLTDFKHIQEDLDEYLEN
mgnify:CR=1 FL=1